MMARPATINQEKAETTDKTTIWLHRLYLADITMIRLQAPSTWFKRQAKEVWDNLQKNRLWQRMLKTTLAVTVAVVLAFIPAVSRVYGKAMYLGCMACAFGHPGRPFGQMAEALVLIISGTLFGSGVSILGVYLSSLVYDNNVPAAFTIKGIFLAVTILIHGYFRSHTPRLWIFVLFLSIVSVVILTGTSSVVTVAIATTVLYPILTACAVLICVNVFVFPELSSEVLGVTTIKTLSQTITVLRDAGTYFANMPSFDHILQGSHTLYAEKAPDPSKMLKRASTYDKSGNSMKVVSLKALTDSKATLRTSLAKCKAAQQACNFELAWSVLPPQDLKPVSTKTMRKLIGNTIALICACESKFACVGDAQDMLERAGGAIKNVKGVAEDPKNDCEKPLHLDTGRKLSDEELRLSRRRKYNRTLSPCTATRSRSRNEPKHRHNDIDLVKARKEIEFGDIDILRWLVARVAGPLANLQASIDSSVNMITACLAYCYDVPNLPSHALTPDGITLRAIDIGVDNIVDALTAFDTDTAAALEYSADSQEIGDSAVDTMPRMEVFLVSSFLLNFRQAASHILTMLQHSRALMEKRQARHGRHRVYLPNIEWSVWLASGGEEDTYVMPDSAKRDVGTDKREVNCDGDDDDDALASSKQEPISMQKARSSTDGHSCNGTPEPGVSPLTIHSAIRKTRHGLADLIDYLTDNEDVLFAVRLEIAVFLVVWPAFIGSWNTWYSQNRGVWAALQLIFVSEVAIGISVWTFVLRLFGTLIGCTWGWAAFEARNGNPYVCVILLFIGILPSTYVQLGSRFFKAGMVSIISMCVVALASVDHTVPGSGTESYLKRMIAFMIGSIIALIVQAIVFPVKARDRLVESLVSSLMQITEMESCLAYGIEAEVNVNVRTPSVSMRFAHAKNKAQAALQAAETFLPSCGTEPRLKGSFRKLALVYAEVIYVLHSIVDRMDNMWALRTEYGSGVLEQINEKVFPYRRQVAGSMILILFAVQEALVTKISLPQFLPSARLAHLRMINRVREVVFNTAEIEYQQIRQEQQQVQDMILAKRIWRKKLLSWNAASAGQIEVIEYLEELVDLVKLLVGAHEFRSGMLTRSAYRSHIGSMGALNYQDGSEESDRNAEIVAGKQGGKFGLMRRKTIVKRKEDGQAQVHGEGSVQVSTQNQSEEEALPRPLQRVRTRRVEEMNLKLITKSTEEAKRE